MKRSRFKPYKQGYLDSLCGIYSVVNATKYISNLSEDDCFELFHASLGVINKTKDMMDLMVDGILGKDISKLFNSLICDQYGIVKKKPFHKNKAPSLDEYWTAIEHFLNNKNRRAVILTVDGEDWSHWTVAGSATSRQLHLLDSDGMKNINRSYCTIKPNNRARYMLYPTHTYFLSRSHRKR